MINLSFSFQAQCWLWQAEKAAWHFITLPNDISEEIKFFAANLTHKRRGWGAVKVQATIGSTTWQTSIFPQTKQGTYILPIKSEVRKKEKICADKMLSVLVTVYI